MTKNNFLYGSYFLNESLFLSKEGKEIENMIKESLKQTKVKGNIVDIAKSTFTRRWQDVAQQSQKIIHKLFTSNLFESSVQVVITTNGYGVTTSKQYYQYYTVLYKDNIISFRINYTQYSATIGLFTCISTKECVIPTDVINKAIDTCPKDIILKITKK